MRAETSLGAGQRQLNQIIRFCRHLAFVVICIGFAGQGIDKAYAAEAATGTYLLGSKGSMAGFLPPPGIYAQDSTYFYTGETNRDIDIAGVVLEGGVKADAIYNIPTVLWVLPGDVLGGNLAFNVSAPVGFKDIKAGLSLTAPGGTILSKNLHDEDFAFGDPVLGAVIGWHSGNFHWNIGESINVPIGFWEEGNPSNIGFNRWSFDTTAAATWIDPRIGTEISGAAGITFNTENPDTHYQTGTESHLELALIQHFSKQFAIGLAGYHYEQLTGDSGSGAVLGDFKGRATALGPEATWSFALAGIPVNSMLTWQHELEVKNRLKGDTVFLSVAFPLSVAGH